MRYCIMGGSVTGKDIEQLLLCEAGRMVLVSAYIESQARRVAAQTGRTEAEVMSIVATLVDAGLVSDPVKVMATFVKLTSDIKTNSRYDLLRDRLVLQLTKQGDINKEQVERLLNGETHDNA